MLAKSADKEATFETLKGELQMDVPSYIVYNLTWTTDDSRKMDKILFINFVPDECSNMALKFSYANYKEAVKSKVNPINKELQINDSADLSEASWIEDFWKGWCQVVIDSAVFASVWFTQSQQAQLCTTKPPF